MPRTHNTNRHEADQSHLVAYGRQAEWQAFDAMPREIRDYLNSASLRYSSVEMKQVIDNCPGPIKWVADELKRLDEVDRREREEKMYGKVERRQD